MASEAYEIPLMAGESSGKAPAALKGFAASAAAILCAVLASMSFLLKYKEDAAVDQHVDQYYMWYIHVAVMIFVGFGFLMTFLKKYSYSAVGLNFFLSALVMLEALVVLGYVQQTRLSTLDKPIEVDLPLFIDSAFAAGAAMISFGAVLGKATPTQLTWLLAIQVPLYAVNQHLVFEVFEALDIGGSMSIHAFGAYYGVAASLFLSPPGAGAAHPKNGASYTSDVTAMIGTVFLWIFWPSFNGALASSPEADVQFQFYCVINTILALLGATVAAFIASSLAEGGRLNMVHVQNATLAGGVAMGSAANLSLPPGAAVALGVVAGFLSTGGYVFVSPLLEQWVALRDTCGVHNLHGMPGITGGLFAALASAVFAAANAGKLPRGAWQPLAQLEALGTTLLLAIAGGALVGYLLSFLDGLPADAAFEDALVWTEEEGEEGHEH